MEDSFLVLTLALSVILGGPVNRPSALPPSRLAPVLPEVTQQLEDGLADAENDTPTRACAHAQLVLLGSQLKYYVKMDLVPGKQREQCLASLHSAMAEWEHDLDGAIRFMPAASTDQSALIVRFEPNVTMNNEPVAGYVNWSRTLNTRPDGHVDSKFSADLQLRIKDLSGKTMPSDAMRHTAMHELGHVLGLDDSPVEGNVMGPLNIDNPVSAPTNLEIETVKSIRARANEILEIAYPLAKK
jgi:predicted Zn-dependent protease